ncbi:MAG: efflux RND transporter periplasmic adaptor subunit, partial [Verrucomicrobiia bacterium]
LARQSFKRAEALLEDRTVSKEEYDRALAQLRAEEAILALERERLADMMIQAPFAGVLSRRRVSAGQYLNVGTPMVTLLAVDRLKIAFSIPERFAGRLAEGQAVELMVSPHPDRVFRGTISFVDPRVDPGTRTVGAVAVVDNRRGELKPGLFATVRVVMGERVGALTIPEEAVFLVGDESTVFVEVDGKAESRTIREGLRLDGRVEVVEGLGPEDRVVLGDSRKLGEGRRLQVRRELLGAEVAPTVSGAGPVTRR